MSYEKDVFCAACGAHIDTISNEDGKDNGFVEALIIADSRAIHKKETGCSGLDGRMCAWNFGPWRETPTTGGMGNR